MLINQLLPLLIVRPGQEQIGIENRDADIAELRIAKKEEKLAKSKTANLGKALRDEKPENTKERTRKKGAEARGRREPKPKPMPAAKNAALLHRKHSLHSAYSYSSKSEPRKNP